MGHFTDAAHRVLSEERRPLSARDLTELGLERGYLSTSGKTPSQTMKSKLSTDILKLKSRSLFMRTAEGKFGLREWKDATNAEYVADRFSKGLMRERVAVFPSSSLSKYVPGTGLHPITLENSEALLAECRPMLREQAEQDFKVVQLISVFILRFGCHYLTYKRTKRLPESRLHGYYSMIFGGHISHREPFQLFDMFRPDHEGWALRRELNEEVRFSDRFYPEIRYKGLLYDNIQPVSTQHLGIAYDVLLKNKDYKIGERGFLMNPKFETLEEIEGRSSQFENWSLLVAQYERRHMTSTCDSE